MQLHTIADEHFNSVQTHFSGEVRKYDLSRLKLYAKEGVRECLIDDSFYFFHISHICGGKNSSNLA